MDAEEGVKDLRCVQFDFLFPFEERVVPLLSCDSVPGCLHDTDIQWMIDIELPSQLMHNYFPLNAFAMPQFLPLCNVPLLQPVSLMRRDVVTSCAHCASRCSLCFRVVL